jgi:hypothetical protein
MSPDTHCPVCGFDLGFEAWRGASSSHQFCSSCGIQFGYDDVPEGAGLQGSRDEIYAMWLREWVAKGMPWFSHGKPEPPEWDPMWQVQQRGLDRKWGVLLRERA